MSRQYQLQILPLILAVVFLCAFSAQAAKQKPVELHPDYNHDRFVTTPTDLVFHFRAYTTSFDSDDDDTGDGKADLFRIPEFVAYEIRAFEGELGKGAKRPSWFTDKQLFKQRIAPGDASYKYSRAFRKEHKNWYDRGHLCAKYHAFRLGRNADWNTHIMLNAVPQLHDFNAGIWKHMENLTAKWADTFGAIWVITGPVFENGVNRRPGEPRKWIGEPTKGELKVAVPDGLFKILIKDAKIDGEIDTLAFYYRQTGEGHKKGPYDHTKHLVSIDWIEKRTGLDFLTALEDKYEQKIERKKNKPLWED